MIECLHDSEGKEIYPEDLKLPIEITDCLLSLRDIYIDTYCGKGGNGYVFFGEHKILLQREALKFYCYDTDVHTEVQLLAIIKHPNILDIRDARTLSGGWAYFITSEVREGDIDSHLEHRLFGLKEAIHIIRGLLEGVKVMHNHNLLHRDLKPANILLDAQGIPVIADFGSVKKVPDGAEFVTGSQHSTLYRPPESYDHGKYTFASDLYQVGLVFYQLLGGYLPYNPVDWFNKSQKTKYDSFDEDYDKSNYTDSILHQKSVRGKLADLSTLPPFVPANIKSIIKTSTNPDYTKRYKSTSEFLLALHKLGAVPDWQILNKVITLIDWQGKDYRIRKQKKDFVCERKSCGVQNWRTFNNVIAGTEEDVIKQLTKLIA